MTDEPTMTVDQDAADDLAKYPHYRALLLRSSEIDREIWLLEAKLKNIVREQVNPITEKLDPLWREQEKIQKDLKTLLLIAALHAERAA